MLTDTESLNTGCDLSQAKDSPNIGMQTVSTNKVTSAQVAYFNKAFTRSDAFNTTGDHCDTKFFRPLVHCSV
jgi:hypothetical protein